MDNIYIDTSIFEANNFFESKRIKQILQLAEEDQIQIVLPAITYNETKNRAIKNIKEAISRFKKYRDESRILRNIPSLKKKFDLLDEKKCIQEFLKEFETKLKKAKCVLLDYPIVEIKEVFEKYFADEFPFSRGEKKHEFPDAFALISIELWCKEKRKKCFVFSNDKDLLNYKSEQLEIIPSYEQYLDEKLRHLVNSTRRKRLERATKIYEEEKLSLEEEVKNWLISELEDLGTYYRHVDQEIHSIDIKETRVSFSDFQIVNINEFEITMEVKANIYYSVEVEIDDVNSGYYDDEDKVWNYTDTDDDIIEKHQIIPVQLKITIPTAGDKYMDILLDEINNGRDLKLKP